MNTRWNEILNEAIGAAVGTTLGIAVIGYGVFSLVTSSLEVVF